MEERRKGPDPNLSVTSWDYIKGNFEPADRLAVVIINKKTNDNLQKIHTAEVLARPNTQRWLRYHNAQGGEIFVSMNPIKTDSFDRKKEDVFAVRHVYVDLDYDGVKSLQRIREDSRIPTPSYVLNTSQGKYQVIWRVKDFDIASAEKLMKTMVAEYGADPATTDITRVLRIPGFLNYKYDPPHLVVAHMLSAELHSMEDFRIPISSTITPISIVPRQGKAPAVIGMTQSHHDWAEVMRRLEHGENQNAVKSWLENYRPDKANPRDYAERTVRRAADELKERDLEREAVVNRLERGDKPADVLAWLKTETAGRYRPSYYADLTVKQAMDTVNQRRQGPALEL